MRFDTEGSGNISEVGIVNMMSHLLFSVSLPSSPATIFYNTASFFPPFSNNPGFYL
jgi:hypothetical protein